MLKLALAFVLLLGVPAGAAEFKVDVSVPLKAVDHAASGALYGIAAPGWPAQSFIDTIRPKNFTQMAPGGHQLPNGETSPVGGALIVAPIAAAAGASVTIRMPDTFPDFPYIWRGSELWAAEVDRITKATVAANPPNIYAYEIWNEPDWNWQPQWGDFNAIWASTDTAIRAIDTHRRIMGPSISKWNGDWMRGFLAAAKASSTVPDVVSWHELDPADADAIEAHVTAFRALETELGLPHHPISINEYASQRAVAVPGALIHYIAQFERAGVDTADLAFWHRPGRLGDLLVPRAAGRGPATDAAPTGAYWLYAWYGGMTGEMVSARPTGSALDGVASYDVEKHRATVIVGGEAGAQTVDISGLGDFGPTAMVTATATHWTGTDGAEPLAEPLFSGRFAVSGGQVSIPLDLPLASDAAELVLTPYPGGRMAAASVVTPAPRPPTQRVEAEAGKIAGGRKFIIVLGGNFGANFASGSAYVGLFNKAGNNVALPVAVRDAGTYRIALAYSNGQAGAVPIDISVNGGAPQRLILPPTQGRELFGLADATVDLPAGDSTLTLSLPQALPGPPIGPSAIEFDYVDVTPEAG